MSGLSAEEVVETLYQAVLKRPADPSGKAHFVNLIKNGASSSDVADALLDSPEYRIRFSARRHLQGKVTEHRAAESKPQPELRTEVEAEGAKLLMLQGNSVSIVGGPKDGYFQGLVSPHRDEVLHVAKHIVRSDDVIFDIGANIGITALAFSHLACDGRVFAFEPGQHNFNFLSDNLSSNSRTNVATSNVAVGSADGAISFFESADFGAGSFALGDQSANAQRLFDSRLIEEKVPLRSIDSFVIEHKISRLDLIKIDVEGAEKHVLDGARATLSLFKPTVILEFNSQNQILYHDQSPRKFLSELVATFDQVFWIDRGSGELTLIDSDAQVNHYATYNLINGFVDNVLCTYRSRGISESTIEEVEQDEDGIAWKREGSMAGGMIARKDYDWLKQQYDALLAGSNG